MVYKMNKIAKFEFVSQEEFNKEVQDYKIYEGLKLPARATVGSAGYDFFAPFDIFLEPGQTIKIPTGIRCKMAKNYVLMIFPRSSLGFKYRMQLNNTVGIIDSDYFDSDNEGHIFIKITNDTNENKSIEIKKGMGFAQGIFLPFGVTIDDDTTKQRNGGFGSTNKSN